MQAGPKAAEAHSPFSLHYRATDNDTLYLKFGFAAGSGLNDVSPFNLSPWAADLQDDVKNINGRGRNYLLTAWYAHDFRFADENTLGITLGIIDATEFLDNNVYANDEYTQFMNEALINSPRVFLPSYDWGVALQWDIRRWSLRTVLMNVGKDDADTGEATNRGLSDDYDYVGAELGYSLETPLGDGNYRVAYTLTSSEFMDPTGSKVERRETMAVSFDQQLGEHLGAFLRLDLQAGKAAVDYRYSYTSGLDIRGGVWGRPEDNVELGFAYLYDGNQDIVKTRLVEGYYRLILDDHFAASADIQYMDDKNRQGENPKGFILGLRVDASF